MHYKRNLSNYQPIVYKHNYESFDRNYKRIKHSIGYLYRDNIVINSMMLVCRYVDMLCITFIYYIHMYYIMMYIL